MEFKISEENKHKIGIYCIKNKINNKTYIGSTGNSFYNRYHQHLSDYKKGKHNGVALKRAFDKYGIVNFEFYIEYICNAQELIEKEQYFINKGVDYNCSLTAGSLLGLKHNENSRTRIVKGGEHHSSKCVYKFDLHGNYIKKYDSVIEAKSDNNIKSSSNITQCCNGTVFSAGGFRWSYTYDVVLREKREGGKIKVALKKDYLYFEFSSQKEASTYIESLGFKCNQSRIHRSMQKTAEKVYGFEIIKL